MNKWKNGEEYIRRMAQMAYAPLLRAPALRGASVADARYASASSRHFDAAATAADIATPRRRLYFSRALSL